MYIIVTYDVNVSRVNKVKKFLRTFLNWVQNSVFEGELTESEIEQVRNRLRRIVNNEEDSVFIYQFRTKKEVKKEVIGVEKMPIEEIL